MSRFEEARLALAREVSERDRRNLVRLHGLMAKELAERKAEVSDIEGAMAEIVQDCDFDDVSPTPVEFWTKWFAERSRNPIHWQGIIARFPA